MNKAEKPIKTDNNRDAKGRFVPGNCANPNGRPRNENSISYLLRHMKDKVPTEIDGKPYTGEKTRVELVAEKVWDGAMAGDVKFAKELLDRIEGPVTQKIETSREMETLQNENNILSGLLAARQGYSEGQSDVDEGQRAKARARVGG